MAQVARGVGGDDFVDRSTAGLDVATVDLALGGKDRGGEDHLLGDVEGQRGLVRVARGGKDLRSRFPIGKQHVEGQGGGDGGLAVLPTEHDQRLSILAQARLVFGVEQRANDVPHLPAIEDKRLATQRTFGVAEKLATEAVEDCGRFQRVNLLGQEFQELGLRWIVDSNFLIHVLNRHS